MKIKVQYSKFDEDSIFKSTLVAKVDGWNFEVVFLPEHMPDDAADDPIDFHGYHWTAEREGWMEREDCPRRSGYPNGQAWIRAVFEFRNDHHFDSNFFRRHEEISRIGDKLIEALKSLPANRRLSMEPAEIDL